MKTNRETALGFFEALVGCAGSRRKFGPLFVARRRNLIRHGLPDDLIASAESHERQAVLVAKKRATYAVIAACLRLAAEPESGCCVDPKHDGRLVVGPGDRRGDCARLSSCLMMFLRQDPRAPSAHCPNDCSAFVQLSTRPETHRRTGIEHMASAGTLGIY